VVGRKTVRTQGDRVRQACTQAAHEFAGGPALPGLCIRLRRRSHNHLIPARDPFNCLVEARRPGCNPAHNASPRPECGGLQSSCDCGDQIDPIHHVIGIICVCDFDQNVRQIRLVGERMIRWACPSSQFGIFQIKSPSLRASFFLHNFAGMEHPLSRSSGLCASSQDGLPVGEQDHRSFGRDPVGDVRLVDVVVLDPEVSMRAASGR
jgi:hypothetical protein